MFERFTRQARKVVLLAQEEARYFKHNYVGTEHLLLGLLREEDGIAGRTLRSLGVGLEAARRQVEGIVGYGDEEPGNQMPFTPRSIRATELALREALLLGHNYIGTEHLLLGLLGEDEGVAARVLSNLGVEPDAVRNEVVRQLDGAGGRSNQLRAGETAARASRSERWVREALRGALERNEGPTAFGVNDYEAHIKGLGARVRCGATAEERAEVRDMNLDLTYSYRAVSEDHPGSTADHAALAEAAVKAIEEREFVVPETAVRLVGERIIEAFPMVLVLSVSATLAGPGRAEGLSVSIEFRA
jgi:ATP-dependent Clp protease ATP-binding subunit ClpA